MVLGRLQRAGKELILAWAAIRKVDPECAQSRTLEARIIMKLMWVSEGGYEEGSHEKGALADRLIVLASDHDVSAPQLSDDAKSEASMGLAFVKGYQGHQASGWTAYRPADQSGIGQVHTAWAACSAAMRQAARLTRDPAKKVYALCIASSYAGEDSEGSPFCLDNNGGAFMKYSSSSL